MTRNEQILELGDVGENLFKERSIANNQRVKMSEDRYDPVKDMFVDDIPTEIKTLVRIITKDAFFLADQQLGKCLNVDKLIFIEVPLYEDFPIDIFESKKPRITIPHFFKKNGKVTRGLLFPLTNMYHIDTIDNIELAKKMRGLSPSNYVNNDPKYKNFYIKKRLELINPSRSAA